MGFISFFQYIQIHRHVNTNVEENHEGTRKWLCASSFFHVILGMYLISNKERESPLTEEVGLVDVNLHNVLLTSSNMAVFISCTINS